MAMFSSDNSHAIDWHLVHIGVCVVSSLAQSGRRTRTRDWVGGQGFAMRGAGGIVMEATAVMPDGCISPGDAGLWMDSQIPPLR